MFPLAKQGKHINCKGVRVFRGEEISVNSDRYMTIHTDGETHGRHNNIKIINNYEKMNIIT